MYNVCVQISAFPMSGPPGIEAWCDPAGHQSSEALDRRGDDDDLTRPIDVRIIESDTVVLLLLLLYKNRFVTWHMQASEFTTKMNCLTHLGKQGIHASLLHMLVNK
jgi:hypothetical protein